MLLIPFKHTLKILIVNEAAEGEARWEQRELASGAYGGAACFLQASQRLSVWSPAGPGATRQGSSTHVRTQFGGKDIKTVV